MDKVQIDILIEKYLDNSATLAELQSLHHWYRAVNQQDTAMPYTNIEEETAAKAYMLAKLQDEIEAGTIPLKNIKKLVYKYAAVAALFLISFILAAKYSPLYNIINPVKQYTNSTKPGERKIIRLPDGSIIWLGADSEVSYPEKFTGSKREVKFSGEAFFKVAKDKIHPFIIHSGNTDTKVLGTSFNIKAFKSEANIEVALVEGKVAFSDAESEIILLPNERVLYNKAAGKMSKSRFADLASILMRREGEFNYNNVPVKDVAVELARNFNIEITVEGNVKDCTFYGRLKKGESADSFINKMGSVVNASIIRTKNGYLIRGGGCI